MNLVTTAWAGDAGALDDAERQVIAQAESILAESADGYNRRSDDVHEELDMLGDVEYHPCEAVCKVTGMTFNKHLGRSPWIDENGEQAW